jgi:flagellar basal body rod protein FlgG
MVSMLAVLRYYEANQKSIQAIDQTLDKVINQMARFA